MSLPYSIINLHSAIKHMHFGSRKAQFYTRTDIFFWPEDGRRVESKKWDDGNTANGDECRGSDGETFNSITYLFKAEYYTFLIFLLIITKVKSPELSINLYCSKLICMCCSLCNLFVHNTWVFYPFLIWIIYNYEITKRIKYL